jgi:hypothetical protein
VIVLPLPVAWSLALDEEYLIILSRVYFAKSGRSCDSACIDACV